MSPYFNEVYMMPEDPVLAGVNAVLKENAKLEEELSIFRYYCN